MTLNRISDANHMSPVKISHASKYSSYDMISHDTFFPFDINIGYCITLGHF